MKIIRFVSNCENKPSYFQTFSQNFPFFEGNPLCKTAIPATAFDGRHAEKRRQGKKAGIPRCFVA